MLFHDSGKETLRYLLDTGDGQSNREGSDKAAAQAYHGAGCRTGHQQIDTPEKAQTRKQGKMLMERKTVRGHLRLTARNREIMVETNADVKTDRASL